MSIVDAFTTGWSLPKPHWALIHYRGCQQIAFLSVIEPKSGQTIQREDCRWPDGSAIENNDYIVCGHCKQPLQQADLQTEYIEPMN